jgi:Fe2+ transport system protein FeoA
MSTDPRAEKHEPIVCLVCGYRFDPAERSACGSCPLSKGCAFVCCPACGYGMVDLEHSRLVRLGSWIARSLRIAWRRGRRGTREATLADVPPGHRARIEALNGLPTSQHEQLQSYGVTFGRWVEVVQQSPVTVVRVEHTDLAFERAIARSIRVTLIATDHDGTGAKEQ